MAGSVKLKKARGSPPRGYAAPARRPGELSQRELSRRVREVMAHEPCATMAVECALIMRQLPPAYSMGIRHELRALFASQLSRDIRSDLVERWQLNDAIAECPQALVGLMAKAVRILNTWPVGHFREILAEMEKDHATQD